MALTVWFAISEYRVFRDQQMTLMENSAAAAGRRIADFIRDRQVLVGAFAAHNSERIDFISRNPDDTDLTDAFAKVIRDFFPSHYAYVIRRTDDVFVPDNFGEFVGNMCRRDMLDFSLALEDLGRPNDHGPLAYEPMIHPMPFNFHYDITTPWKTESGRKGLFMVSFHPDTLVEILRQQQTPRHELFLFHADDPALIEASANGWRETMKRDGRLDDNELDRVIHNGPIDGTRWQIGYLPNEDVFDGKVRQIASNAATILSVLLLLAIVSISWYVASARSADRSRRVLEEKVEALRRSERKAELASHAKSEFLATMSHEIRTPLTGIMGFSDILLDHPLNDEIRGKVVKIKSSSRLLLDIINDILDISKLEAGKMKIEHIDFHVPSLIDDVLSQFRAKLTAGGGEHLELRSVLSDDFPQGINADPTRLRQILFNLIGNAVKFTDQGSVTVRGARFQKPTGEDFLRIAVEDTGIGLKAETMEGLFSEFTQADASITRKYEGTGLGLSICKRLIELMGGDIGVESRFGEGSTFWITLPYVGTTSNHAEGVDRPSADARFQTLEPLHVLIVDDNAVNRQIIQALMQAAGHSMEMVENGKQAVESHRADEFDLILMDVRMPELSGPEATRMIRASDRHPDVPIIALTADAMEDHVREYLEAGMDACVTKPINRGDLMETINRVMGKTIHLRLETAGEDGGGNVEHTPEAPKEPDRDIEALLERMQGIAGKDEGSDNQA